MQFLPRSVVFRMAVLMIGCGVCPSAVHGQSAQTPVRGWLGSGRIGPGETQTLSLTGSLITPLGDTRELSAPALVGGIRYDRKTRSRSWYFAADSTHLRSEDFGGLASTSHDAAAGFSTALGRRTQVHFTQSFRSSPFYQVTVVPRELAEEPAEPMAPQAGTDYALFRQHTRSLSSGAAFSYLLARHTSLSVDYSIEQREIGSAGFTSQYVKAGVSHYLGRYAVARAGYARRLVDREGPAESFVADSHDIDGGIDYNRPWSLTRRTTMAITTSSAIVPVEGHGLHYRFLGAASLRRELGRSWNASLNYGRNLEFVETFAEPLLSDSVSASVQGHFHRRLDLAVTANLSKGAVGFAKEDASHGFDTYGGSARLRWTATRLISSYAEYVVYSHAFGTAVQMPVHFDRHAKRSEVRVGVTVWAPLIR